MFDAITTAIEQFWHFLSDIAILPLLAAIGCHLLKLACTSRAWRNVLAAAYPDLTVRWPPILAAYVSGVGVNAILPARGGDVVRVFLAHRAIPGSSYTTIVASTVVLIFVDMALALLVFAWALTQGVLPSLDAVFSAVDAAPRPGDRGDVELLRTASSVEHVGLTAYGIGQRTLLLRAGGDRGAVAGGVDELAEPVLGPVDEPSIGRSEDENTNRADR